MPLTTTASRWRGSAGGMIASKLRGITKCIVPAKAKKAARARWERVIGRQSSNAATSVRCVPAANGASSCARYGQPRARVQAQPRLHADRRPAEGDRRAGRGAGGGRAVPDPARRDRHRQDLHDGGDDRRGAAALAGDRPQQDAGGAALQRVPRVLPRQRGRVLRLLLRLLPARGLRPGTGPLHREGLLDQRRDRPPAPRRDGGAVRPPRRDHRRLGLLHLRDRLAPGLQRKNAALQSRRARSTATRCCASW